MIRVQGLTKRFGRFVAVDGMELTVRGGELLTLLGPSGCGKTTTLRMIAGLEDPDEGEITIGDRCVFSAARGILVPPAARGVGLIFQSYAVWPHMTVFENVAFGLEERRLPRADVTRRVREVLATMQLDGLDRRYPSELSGGQQQRVAVARALVVRPQVLLMDEPLSNLDAKLRLEMRAELKRLHVLTGTTTIYVTHDQYEALTLSDRVAVMRAGRIEQLGPPLDLYHRPANLYVAGFVGSPAMNVVPGRLEASDGGLYFAGSDFRIRLDLPVRAPRDVMLGIRPEHVRVGPGAAAVSGTNDRLSMRVYSVLPAGSETLVHLRRGSVELMARCPGSYAAQVDDEVPVGLDGAHVSLFDPATGTRLATGASGGSPHA